jgi:hypothetical protein
VLIDLKSVPVEERNLLWLTFVAKEWRCTFVDAESTRMHMVAGFRAALADHLTDPNWLDLTQRLLAGSRVFADLWERYEVAAPSNKIKLLESPTVGILRLEPINMWLTQLGQIRATVYTAADPESEAKLHTLVTTGEPG